MSRKVSRGAIFNQNVSVNIPHTTFDLSHSNKFSCKPGYLYPIFCKRVVPGDFFQFTDQVLLRTMPMVTPAFVDFEVDVRYFYIPNRLVWKDFDDFITNPDQDTLIPPTVFFSLADSHIGDIFDFLGCPSVESNGSSYDFKRDISAYRFRAYNLIWNTWYRDQNLQTELPDLSANGGESPDAMAEYQLLHAAWKRDYFTSCLPDAQFGSVAKGALSVEFVPNGDFGKIVNPSGSVYQPQNPAERTLRTENLGPLIPGGPDPTSGNLYSSSATYAADMVGSNSRPIAYDPNGTLKSFLSVSELREMSALQRFRERLMVGGRRIKEYIKSMFGIDIPDYRAQYPEFLGGGSIPITIGDVPQTSSTDATSPQGNLAGRGVSANSVFVPTTFIPEYGFIIGVMVVRPRADYFQGLDRELTQMDYYDYFNPMFEHIGEQEVLKSELFGLGANSDGLFGYQSRNADYKYYNNEIHGQMRDVGLSLGRWHLARLFANAPSLNSDFITCKPDIDRIMAVDGEDKLDQLVVQLRHHIISSRPMSEFSTPSLIG